MRFDSYGEDELHEMNAQKIEQAHHTPTVYARVGGMVFTYKLLQTQPWIPECNRAP